MPNVTPQENVNAFAVYDIKKIRISTNANHVSVKQNGVDVNGKDINYGSDVSVIANSSTGYHLTTFTVNRNPQIGSGTTPDSKSVNLKTVKANPEISTVYAIDEYEIQFSDGISGGTATGNVKLNYNENKTLTFTPVNDYYLSKVSCKADMATLVSNGDTLQTSGVIIKTITANKDLTHNSNIIVTPTFSQFVYKLVEGTLTECSVEVKKDNNKQSSATCRTEYDVVVTPSAGHHHIVGDATLDMNQTLTNGTADGDGKTTYKWTPTLIYNTDGTPNNWVSGTKEIKINASCVADQYPLTITATGGDNDANNSFKVQRTSDNTIGGTDSKQGEIQNGGNLYYNDNIQLTYTPDTTKYHVKEGPTLSVGGSPVTLSGSDGAKTYTLSDYAHNTRVNASITYTANTYTLNWTNDANGNVSVSVKNGSTPITSGSTISADKTYTITATPTKKQHGTENVDIATLTSLTIDGSIISSGDTYTPSGANSGSKNIQAVFSPIMCQITKGTSDHVTIKLSGADSNDKVQKSKTFKFTADAETGYYLSTFGSTSYTQTDNKTSLESGDITVWDNMTVGGTTGTYAVVASIKQFKVTPSITYNPSTIVDKYKTGNKIQYKVGSDSSTDLPSGGKNFEYNTEVSFKAVSGTYCDVEIDASPKSLKIQEASPVTATFKLKTFSVTIGSFTGGIVTASELSVQCGSTTTITATPDTTNGYYISKYPGESITDHSKKSALSSWKPTIESNTTITTSDIAFDNKYDVSFVVVGQKGAGDGVSDDKKTVEYNTSLGKNMPTNPTAIEGYTFNGWNTKKDGSGDGFDGTTTVTSDNVVYAKYTAWDFEFTKTESGVRVTPNTTNDYFSSTINKSVYDTKCCKDGVVDNTMLINYLVSKGKSTENGVQGFDVVSFDGKITFAVYVKQNAEGNYEVVGNVKTQVW